MQLSTLVNAAQDLNYLSTLKIPNVKVSYRIGVTIPKIEAHLKSYNAAHKQILETYGTPLEDKSGRYNIAADRIKEFNEQSNELLSQEVDEDIKPIFSISDLSDVTLSPSKLYRIYPWLMNCADKATPTIEATVSQIYDGFVAIIELGSQDVKGDIQQKILHAGCLVYNELVELDKVQRKIQQGPDLGEKGEGTVPESIESQMNEFRARKIPLPINKIKLDSLQNLTLKPFVFSSLSWLIEE